MCGICGVYSQNLSGLEITAFKTLLHLNVMRGEDSTGVIRLSKNDKGVARVYQRRSLDPSPVWLYSKAGKEFVNRCQTNNICLIGHTRAATQGKITIKNTHPFDFSDIVGVHNGTIPGAFPNYLKFDTDSEALYSNINNHGILEALKPFETQAGAYVLVWINKKEGTLNFVRNSKRPLFFTFVYAKQTLIWSSLKEHLVMTLKQLKLGTGDGWPKNPEGVEGEGIFTLKPNYVLSISVNGRPDSAKITNLKIKEFKGAPFGGKYGISYNSYQDNYFYNNEKYTKGGGVYRKRKDGEYRTDAEEILFLGNKSSKDFSAWNSNLSGLPGDSYVDQDPSDPDDPGDPDDFDDPAGLPWLPSLNAQQSAHVQEGCICCHHVPSFEEEKDLVWLGDFWYACRDCYDTSPGDWVRKQINGEVETVS